MANTSLKSEPEKPYFLWKHLNKLRWVTLVAVFTMLIALPFFHVYQTFIAAHGYDLLAPSEKSLYDAVESVTAPFVTDAQRDLDAIKGTTWSGNFWGYKISDPLAVLGQIASSMSFNWVFFLTALVPIIMTLIFGRFFCGWICPATLLYELNGRLSALLNWAGYHTGNRRFDKRLKYGVLAVGFILSALSGSALFATIYPPAILGREIYYTIALGGFGAGILFFVGTLAFDLLVARRGFCRYVCPGGALYSILGQYRPIRIKRIVETCNDCAKCNAVCEFGLDPLRDNFGQECNNCTACIAICPTDAMTFIVSTSDYPAQGPGHLGKQYRREHKDDNSKDDNSQETKA